MNVENTAPVGAFLDSSLAPEWLEIADFRPYAYFDSDMDCIRVYTNNRSVTEDRKDDFLTLYRTNHATLFESPYCGFALKGIRHLFDELGIAEGAELRLADLIDRIVTKLPQSTMAKILQEFPVDDLQVEWPEKLAA